MSMSTCTSVIIMGDQRDTQRSQKLFPYVTVVNTSTRKSVTAIPSSGVFDVA